MTLKRFSGSQKLAGDRQIRRQTAGFGNPAGANCDLLRFDLSSGGERYQIHATATLIGDDLLVAIWGGTKPHIGAVAVALPRPSLTDPFDSAQDKPRIISSTSSVFTLLGHKEDEVVKMVSERLSARLEKNVVVTAGIHWDNLPEEAIEEVVYSCRKLADEIHARIIREGGSRLENEE